MSLCEKGYKLLNLETKNFVLVDALFKEDVVLFKHSYKGDSSMLLDNQVTISYSDPITIHSNYKNVSDTDERGQNEPKALPTRVVLGNDETTITEPRILTRLSKEVPLWKKDYIVDGNSVVKCLIVYHVSDFVSCASLSKEYRVFASSVAKVVKPVSLAKVVKDKIWINAMSEKIMTLKYIGIWKLVNAPSDKNIVGCK